MKTICSVISVNVPIIKVTNNDTITATPAATKNPQLPYSTYWNQDASSKLTEKLIQGYFTLILYKQPFKFQLPHRNSKSPTPNLQHFHFRKQAIYAHSWKNLNAVPLICEYSTVQCLPSIIQ